MIFATWIIPLVCRLIAKCPPAVEQYRSFLLSDTFVEAATTYKIPRIAVVTGALHPTFQIRPTATAMLATFS